MMLRSIRVRLASICGEHGFVETWGTLANRNRSHLIVARIAPTPQACTSWKDACPTCEAHFTNEDYVVDKSGKRERKKTAVPSIPAELEVDSDSEEAETSRPNVPLPLYSSPALQDHNYVDFILSCTRWNESDDDEPVTGTTTAKICASPGKEIVDQPPVKSQRSSSSHIRCAKTIKQWKRKTSFWKSKALMWQRKYEDKTEKESSNEQKLIKLFHKNQSDVLLGRITRVQKWSKEMVLEGLKVRFVCGSGYDTIRQLPYVVLPSYRSLTERLQSIHFDTGYLREFHEFLKIKVPTMSDDELDCGGVLDEVSIDEGEDLCSSNHKNFGKTTLPPSDDLATHAIVFMLVGIKVRWKQVIAYDFTGNSIPKGALKSRVDTIIQECESIGLRIHFFTADYGAANRTMWHDYGVSTKKDSLSAISAIPHPVAPGRTLEFIPDPVHVFKNIVQGWLSNSVLKLPDWYVSLRSLNSNIVDTAHLTRLVQTEQNQRVKMAYNLMPADVDFEHLKISNVDKMKVSNSTKYCNNHLAAALNVLADQTGELCLKTTAAFIADLVLWYEAGAEGHWKPWQFAFVMSTTAVLRLARMLIEEKGYSEVFCSRFDQNCLESLFSVVRSKQKRPTALQFRCHLRTIAISQYMREVPGSSYDMDEGSYLNNFMDYVDQKNKEEKLEKKKSLAARQIVMTNSDAPVV
ncbi:hypothetical protein pipiens_014134, partial [Culex pipiens pipiens]